MRLGKKLITEKLFDLEGNRGYQSKEEKGGHLIGHVFGIQTQPAYL